MPATGRQTARVEAAPPRASRPASQRLSCIDWRELSHRIDEWNSLAESASEPNPFMESWFLLPALKTFADDRVRIACFEEDGVLRGLLPLHSRNRYYRKPLPHLSSWLHDNCFLGIPLVATGYEVAFWRAVFDWADTAAGVALFLHLGKLTIGGPVHAALDAVAATQSRRCELVLREQRAMLESSLSPDAYWEASLSAKKRKELRRQANRLAELGNLCFERAQDGEALESWIDRFLTLEGAGWKGKAGSSLAASPAKSQLFREALAGAGAQGKLERLTISLDRRPIAMLANFLTPPGAFSFKTAFDENFARFSPGVLLQQHNLALLERPGIAWTDSCAAEDHPMIDHIWRERRAIGHFSVAIGGRLRRGLFGRLADIESARRPDEDRP